MGYRLQPAGLDVRPTRWLSTIRVALFGGQVTEKLVPLDSLAGSFFCSAFFQLVWSSPKSTSVKSARGRTPLPLEGASAIHSADDSFRAGDR